MSQADAAQGDGSEVDFQEIVLWEPKSRSHVVESLWVRVDRVEGINLKGTMGGK